MYKIRLGTYFIGNILIIRAIVIIIMIIKPEVVFIKPKSVASRSILYIVSNDQVFFWIEVSHSWSQTNGILKTLLTNECSSIFTIYYLIKINFVSCMDSSTLCNNFCGMYYLLRGLTFFGHKQNCTDQAGEQRSYLGRSCYGCGYFWKKSY